MSYSQTGSTTKMVGTSTEVTVPGILAAERGDELIKAGRIQLAIDSYLAAAGEPPSASICLKLARAHEQLGNLVEARRWALAVVDAGDDFLSWQSAWALLKRGSDEGSQGIDRCARVALVGSYTTTQLAQALQLALRRLGIALEFYESDYGQYRQEIVDPQSRLYSFEADFVVLAVHEADLGLPAYSTSPAQDIEAETRRWTELWKKVAELSKARVV